MSQAEMDAMMAGAQQQMPQGMPGQMPQGMPPQGMPGQMPYGAYPPPQYGAYPQQPYPYPQMPPYGGYPQPMNVQNAQLNAFDAPNVQLTGEQKTNLQLLMGVPLEISVEIGTAKRKVKEILEFTQGTIIELERQAGAPVDIIVNGNLIAKGDIVVIDDNFAVRITEIIKSKLMDSINKE
jgi:flagellar motor switch protein FliN